MRVTVNNKYSKTSITSLLLLLFILSYAYTVSAQVIAETVKERSKSKEYNEAEDLAKQATATLITGDIKLAESLIKKSIETYPTLEVFEYAKTLGKLPDVLGANLIIDQIIERAKYFPASQLIMHEPFGSKFVDGKMIATVKKYDKDRALIHFMVRGFEVNSVLGDRKWIIYSLEKISKTDIVQDRTKTEYDYETNIKRALLIALSIFQNNFDKAIAIINDTPISPFYSEVLRKSELMSVYVAQEDYNQAITAAEHLENKDASNIWLFNLYALNGDITAALEHYNNIPDEFRNNNSTYYHLALLDLHKKDFTNALKNLTNSINLRGEQGIEVFMLVEKWKLYKALGDAYAGLDDYEKAKNNYEISLLYFPTYQPATDALSHLEIKYAQDVSADKVPPMISLIEPALNRGLIITSVGKKVMVKGMANDPSGIKEVVINGNQVYTQPSGDFWGDVNMVAGLNKITIKATDKAGNASEKVFEIQIQETPAANSSTNNEIAVKNEGKNYCVLIASQHYQDSAIPTLENPIADAVKLKLVLKNNYNFTESNIITLFNPVVDDLKRQLLELGNTLQPNDNLLIFYAGHGIWVEQDKKGYWLLSNSKYKDVNTWLPNKDVLDLIAKLPSRHTLLITDACFSGSVFKTRGLGADAPIALQKINNKISRVAITSGNDTEVPDESVFMKHLIKALSENKEPYLTAQKMFVSHIIEAVMTESKTEPRYGTLESAGHIGGDYIFIKK